MRLSIIIPTYNEEKYLPKLLETIKRQTFRDYEIIVADAQSADTTREIAAEFGARVVDGGLPGAARNHGAAAALGSLFLFLDADVILPHIDFLGSIVQEFEVKKLGIATCTIIPLDGQKIDALFCDIYYAWIKLLKKHVPHANGACIMASRATHQAIGGFDEKIQFAEDHEYAIRAGKISPFDILQEKILVSMRRFDRDGRALMVLKYITCEAYLLMGKRITKDTFKYRFGYNNEKH